MTPYYDKKMKILIVSHNSFSTTHNNGKTLSAIFSAFLPEELCQLYFTAIGRLDYERCRDYYFISDQEALKSIYRRNKCGYSLPQTEVPKSETSISQNKKSRPNRTKKFLRSLVWMLSAWYNGGLNKWIEKQKPNVIFFVGGDSFFSHSIAIQLSNRLKIPLVTYFTDDYVLNPPSDLYIYLLRYYYRKTIDRSSKLFAIGTQMADDYSTYYQREFKPIMNIVDIPFSQPQYANSIEKLTINYFGGLHLGRAHELIRFAHYMKDKVRPYMESNYTISIFTFATPTESEKTEMDKLGVLIYPGIRGNELNERMGQSDVLLHVESIEEKFHSLTKLSVSTKIPEYMCLAKPIIAFGPTDVASFRVIADANSTLVINDVDNEQVMNIQAKKLADILNSKESIELIAKNNFDYAKTNFDKSIVAKQFRSELSGVNG